MAKIPFREQMLQAREDAIVATVGRLLAEKGFEAMTIDEVAADVGIAKASLYKHFASKEALAATAMVLVLERALAVCASLAADPSLDALGRMRAMARWAMQEQLAGRMPSLPIQNSTLRVALMGHRRYIDLLIELSEQLGVWIEAARGAGQIDSELPAELALLTLFACACDPVLAQLKSSGEHSDDTIVEWLLRARFAGLCGPGMKA